MRVDHQLFGALVITIIYCSLNLIFHVFRSRRERKSDMLSVLCKELA